MMKKVVAAIVAILAFSLTAPCARAQGTVTWTAGSPSQGAAGTGVINISATFTLDNGYTYRNAVVAYWPAGGGAIQTVQLQNNNGTVTGKVTVNPNSTWNFTVQVGERMGGTLKTLASDTKQQTGP